MRFSKFSTDDEARVTRSRSVRSAGSEVVLAAADDYLLKFPAQPEARTDIDDIARVSSHGKLTVGGNKLQNITR